MVMSHLVERVLEWVTTQVGIHGQQLGLVAILVVVGFEARHASGVVGTVANAGRSTWLAFWIIVGLAFGGGITVHPDWFVATGRAVLDFASSSMTDLVP